MGWVVDAEPRDLEPDRRRSACGSPAERAGPMATVSETSAEIAGRPRRLTLSRFAGGPVVKMIVQRIALGILLLVAVSGADLRRHADPARRRRHGDARPAGDAGGHRQHPRRAWPRSAGRRPLFRLAGGRACTGDFGVSYTQPPGHRDQYRQAARKHAVPCLRRGGDRGAAGDLARRAGRALPQQLRSIGSSRSSRLSTVSLPEFFVGLPADRCSSRCSSAGSRAPRRSAIP